MLDQDLSSIWSALQQIVYGGFESDVGTFTTNETCPPPPPPPPKKNFLGILHVIGRKNKLYEQTQKMKPRHNNNQICNELYTRLSTISHPLDSLIGPDSFLIKS